jgi:hypothetical protein
LVNVGVATSGSRTAPTSTTVKSTKRILRAGRRVINYNNEEVEDFDKDCVAIAKHDFKWRTRPPKDHFEKILMWLVLITHTLSSANLGTLP